MNIKDNSQLDLKIRSSYKSKYKHSDSNIADSYELSFLSDVVIQFFEYSKVNIFGIDFIRNENVFYIVDVNYFPSMSPYFPIHLEFIEHFQWVYDMKNKK